MNLKSADSWFSKFIRARDCNGDGILFCISCGDPVFWKKADAGHFIKRLQKYKSLWFNEKNVNGQCTNCNWLLQGNDINYAKGLDKKYGTGIIEQLEIAKRNTFHLGQFELKIIAAHYRQKFYELKEEKGL